MEELGDSEGARSTTKRSHLRLFRHLIRMPPGHLSLEETPGQTQKSPEGLHISSGLKTPQDAPGGAGKCCWREGRLLTKPAAQATQPWVSREGWMDGWMETALLFTSWYNISIRKTCFSFRNANKATSVVVFLPSLCATKRKVEG